MSKDQKSEAYPKITEDPNYATMATLPGSVRNNLTRING